jgi:hypothetical protein
MPERPTQTVSAAELHTYRIGDDMRRPGNQNAVKRKHLYAVKSGAHSFNRRTSRLSAKLWDALPWLADTDEPVVRAWAQAEILSTELFAYLMKEGVINSDGGVSGLLAEWRRTKQHQLKLEQEMGMTPSSRAKLGLDIARGQSIDFAVAIAETREAQKDGEANA